MLTNIQGLVDRLDLAPPKGLMPLFEALSNAMDAIEERSGNQLVDRALGPSQAQRMRA